MAGQPKTRAKEAAASREWVRRSAPAWQDGVLVAEMEEDLEDGCSYEVTGLAHGLGHTTLGKWVAEAVEVVTKLADEPDAEVKGSLDKVAVGVRLLRAHASASQGLERRLNAGEMWCLEVLARRHRGTWGRHDALTLDGPAVGAGLAVLIGRLGEPEPQAE